MANTFMKAEGGKLVVIMRRRPAGKPRGAHDKSNRQSVSIHLPSDSTIADKFDEDANTGHAPSNNIPDGWMGLILALNACEQFANVIRQSKVILWNGRWAYLKCTNSAWHPHDCRSNSQNATELGAYSLVGGGDSVAAVNQFGLADKVSYVSTGGERCSSILKEENCPA
jgi:phosphoglycerate kinase